MTTTTSEPAYHVRLGRFGFAVCYQGADRGWYPLDRRVLIARLPADLHPREDGYFSARFKAAQAVEALSAQV